VALCLLFAGTSQATERQEDLFLVRVTQNFPEAMNTLQQAIVDQGYELIRVQRVDIGLTKSGYQTAEYRIVFFGKRDEIHEITGKHPDVIPYIPLKLVIFAEGKDTLILGTNPRFFDTLFPKEGLSGQFQRWEKDIKAILDRVQYRGAS
jgi:uncharacterized protein (DUF302 family)